MAVPYVQTSGLIRKVTRLIMPSDLEGPVFAYYFDGATLYDMGYYEPGETLPEYRQTRIGGCLSAGSNCCPVQLTALVKLQFIPARRDDDLILISNIDALATAIQGIKKLEAYESADAEVLFAEAVHELNLELRDKMPNDTTPVRLFTQGTASLRRQRIGRMM